MVDQQTPVSNFLMNLLIIFFTLTIFTNRIESFLFNLDSLEKDNEEISNGMPNITTSLDASRAIGAKPVRYVCVPPSVKANTNLPVERLSVDKLLKDFAKEELAKMKSVTTNVSIATTTDIEDAADSQNSSNYSRLPPITRILKLTDNLNTGENDRIAVKRTRSVDDEYVEEEASIDYDVEIYIRKEFNYCAFRKEEKRTALRNVISFISRNDYEGFLAYEQEFISAFKHYYHLFKRGPSKSDYMMHYIIRFGATDFLDSYSYNGRTSDSGSEIESAFDHLIATKPLNVVMKFIRKMRHMDRDSVTQTISTSMREHHPYLHFLDYVVFELNYAQLDPSNIEQAFKIFDAESEEDKLNQFITFMSMNKLQILHNHKHYSHARYLEVPIRYPNYFKSLSIDTKFMFAELAVVNEDIEKLAGIIDMDPQLALYNPKHSLFGFAALHGYSSLFKFFMEIVPELVDYEEENKRSPIFISIDSDLIHNLMELDMCGYDLRQPISHWGRMLTPVQISFNYKRINVFNFLIDKLGKEHVLADLLKLYGCDDEIKKHVLRPPMKNEMLLIVQNRLGLKF